MAKYDYRCKEVFMGIDVHKKTYSCVTVCDGEVVKQDSMPASPDALLAYIKNNFAGSKIKTVYEAGFSGFHLHRFLLEHGINNIVVHPGSIEVASRDRVKTDKRDALKMATQLSAGRLRGIFVPSLEQESKRSISRLRKTIWKSRQRAAVQFKSLLFTQGLIPSDDDTRTSKKWIEKKLHEVEQCDLPEDFKYTAKQYVEQWSDLSDRLKVVENKLKAQANDDKLAIIYESVPGIGLIHGRELANELGDMTQFSNEKQLFSYLGLTPSEYSSGEHIRQGNISRQGRSVLRKIMIEAAWVAIRKDPSLLVIFNRLKATRGAKRAIVAIARRLAGRIRSCLQSGELYNIESDREASKKQFA